MLWYEAVEFSNRVGPSYIRCLESSGPMAGGLDSWKCHRYMHSSHVFPSTPILNPESLMVGSVLAKAGASLHSCEHLILTSFTSLSRTLSEPLYLCAFRLCLTQDAGMMKMYISTLQGMRIRSKPLNRRSISPSLGCA